MNNLKAKKGIYPWANQSWWLINRNRCDTCTNMNLTHDLISSISFWLKERTLLASMKSMRQDYLVLLVMIFSTHLRFRLVSAVKRAPFSEAFVHRRPDINIRLANTDDIPLINQCNLDNLPENYSHYYYLNHLSKWYDKRKVITLNYFTT